MTITKPKILIVDDDRTVCQSLRLLFMTKGFEVQYLINPLNVIEFIDSFKPEVVLLDLNFSIETSGQEGLEILEKIKKSFQSLPVLLFTAWGTLELAVAGMKAGAVDFLTKPWDNEELISAVKTQLLLKQNQSIEQESSLNQIVGNSEAMKNLRTVVSQVSQTDATVIISGDKGTGKTHIAEIMHELSLRKNLVNFKLYDLTEEQTERELLGYKKGVFQGASRDTIGVLKEVNEGTLLWEGIENLTLPMQSKLLKILQEKQFCALGSDEEIRVKSRWISTSQVDLKSNKDFREDFLYKMGLVSIQIPALSERPEDIPALAQHFIDKLNLGERKKKMDSAALEWLSTQDFAGNVAEIKQMIERTWLLSPQYTLTIKELKKNLDKNDSNASRELTLDEMEINMIQKAISQKKGNMSEVAKKLGITRSSLYRRMNKFGIINPNLDEN
jgi:two-component system NtrC family response regulator